ncbi:uncharacterized protein LY79DRAFT_384840 [Colletotrichum navitas]|uniref:Secreted protein n=1 Tax=Colletotrichum navitas TaxID=681940 RepID=A0AAD8Q8S1_9PEZI|nr:uncharacterized protein LY79DRAFT_384840 [Colletotrichum navitas]KAK1597401.1 hypothetical protein LY79DRAFT_384840 [Colletotrichum navitas]
MGTLASHRLLCVAAAAVTLRPTPQCQILVKRATPNIGTGLHTQNGFCTLTHFSLRSTPYAYKDLTSVPAFYAKLRASPLLLIFHPLTRGSLAINGSCRCRIRASPCHPTRRSQSSISSV